MSNFPKPVATRCELDENLEILRRIPIFSAIPLQRLKLYAYLSKRVSFRAGQFIFRQREIGDRGYIIVSGRVQVIREFPDHSVLLNEFKEGDFFGGLALLSDINRLFSVRSVTSLECLTWDRESFQKLLIQFPEVALQILDMMIKRIIQMEEKLLQTQLNECVYG
jgi:CRP/FNR family transcriptional regulator, cyclic AMP receptor protein